MSAVLAHFARDEGVDIRLHLMIVPATDMRYCSPKLAALTKDNCPYESARLFAHLPWGGLGREKWFLRHWIGEDPGTFAIWSSCPPPQLDRRAVLTRSVADEQERILNHDWTMTPMLAPNFRGLAPAHMVTAEFDLERDEGEAYARMLKAAGNVVTMKRYTGCPHAFAHYNDPSKGLSKSLEFIEDTAELLRSVHFRH